MGPIPPNPVRFHPELAPVGVEVDFVSFYLQRHKITPRAQHVHTNAASGEGSIESARRWSEAKPNQNTCPHYQVDRTHSGRTRACKMLPTDRKGIGSTTVSEHRGEHGNVAEWTIVIETADTGTKADPTISAFDDGQAEMVATILAYEALTHRIPLEYPDVWWGAGTACHTEPFTYPYTTLYRGKTCPGDKKKAQTRELILPRARQIVAAWTAKPPSPPIKPPDQEDDLYIDSKVLANVHTAPPVALVQSGEASDWLQVAVMKAMLKQVTGSNVYDQAAAEALDELIK